MQISPSGLKITVNERQKKTQIPNSLQYFFITSQILFGYDYGFIMALKKCLRVTVKRFVLLETLFYIFVISLTTVFYHTEFVAWIPLIEYLLNILALRSTQYKTFDFIMDIHKNIEILKNDRKVFFLTTFINNIIVCAIKMFILISLRAFNFVTYSEDYQFISSWGYYLAYIIPTLGMDTVAVSQIVVFYYTYMYVRNLKNQFKSSEVEINRTAQYFVNLADCCDKIGTLRNKLVSN